MTPTNGHVIHWFWGTMLLEKVEKDIKAWNRDFNFLSFYKEKPINPFTKLFETLGKIIF